MDVANILQNTLSTSISTETVRRSLKKSGMKSIVKVKKPFLSAKHKKARLDFAFAHKDWTVEDWKRVIWSDETKINCLGSDGNLWGWKKAGEGLSSRLVEGTVKFGGGRLMKWGWMSWNGVGYCCKIDGRMDGELYTSILEDELENSLEWWGKSTDDIIFQQDNDPKHTSKMAKSWFKKHGIEVMEWPAQSADLNPIEDLWFHLKKRVGGYENGPNGMVEVWERVEKEWEEMKAEVCQNLILSMAKRVQAVLKAKGGHSKY